MLKNLSVWNFALIEHAELEFGEGLNILTGETGAGKSILIDALSAVLGQRTGTNLIRTGCENLRVEAVFLLEENSAARKILSEMEIEIDDDTLIIARKVNRNSKNNSIVVNGFHVTLTALKKIGAALVDVHGQNENLAILREENIYSLIDGANSNILSALQDYKKIFESWRTQVKNLEEKKRAMLDSEQRLEMLQWQEKEISQADLKPNEDEELENELNRLSNAEKISAHVEESCQLLYGDSDLNILTALAKVEKNLNEVARFDTKLNPALEMLTDAKISLQEVYSDIRAYADIFDFSPETLDEIQNRMDIIYRLKRKYGDSVEKILAHLKKVRAEIAAIENFDTDVESLQKLISTLEEQTKKRAAILFELRKKAAEKVSKVIEREIRRLGMPKAKFILTVENSAKLTSNGGDTANILFSANVGEDLKPLSKIVSGGELSRIALAIKTVSAGREDSAATMIFDEIDAGLGGITAKVVAECIAKVSKSKQVLCVTHLAQIACMADIHIQISKSDDGNRTVTNVTILDAESRVNEIARMASGVENEVSLKNARSMLGI
ncbi:MAG: DNA repair protein RecN [Selenomonadaceae bacterium]|nr:DNA repair protein RecN [Selenomonadaceae bacterium]